MEQETINFDRFLPTFPIISNPEILLQNFSSSIWNKTDLLVPSEKNITLYRHPILYGAAIYALLLIIIGTIGNILTIIILLRPNLRQHGTMRYLIAVAVADLFTLYTWNLNLFYKHLINPYQNDLEDASFLSCRLISFVAFVSLQLSSWYLTLVSVDRCLNIHFLFWNRGLGRADYVIYFVLGITIIILFLNSHLLFLNGYQEPDCIPYGKRTCFVCYARLDDADYIFPRWEKLHILVYNIIPFSIMLISTCFIISRSIPAAHLQRTVSTQDGKGLSHNNTRQRKQRQVTCVLLSVTFSFVFLTTPVMIYSVFFRNLIANRKPLKYIVQGVLLCVQFTNHAINFFVYCYGASNFRTELNEFFLSCFRKSNSANQSRGSIQNSLRR